jgi:hypothetical protein
MCGKKRIAYGILVGKLECKKSLGMSKRRWEDNINIELSKIGWSGID